MWLKQQSKLAVKMLLLYLHANVAQRSCQNDDRHPRWMTQGLLIVMATLTHSDLNVQIQGACRSHAPGCDFASHTHVVQTGIGKSQAPCSFSQFAKSRKHQICVTCDGKIQELGHSVMQCEHSLRDSQKINECVLFLDVKVSQSEKNSQVTLPEWRKDPSDKQIDCFKWPVVYKQPLSTTHRFQQENKKGQ